MGVYRRADSPYWYMWLETAQRRVKTAIPVGVTIPERKASRRVAEEAYHAEMLALGQSKHGLHVDKPHVTFQTFASWYDTHIAAHHRGVLREREILKQLTKVFGSKPLAAIAKTDVLEWRTARAAATSAATSNRELDVLKHLFTAAVPRYLVESPIVKLKRLRPAKRETRVLTPKEEVKLLAVLAPADRALVLCAIDTLMRLSDVVNLRRDQDRGKYLLVVDPKVEPYKVPVSARLREAFSAVPQLGPYYFPHRRKALRPRDYRSSVRKMLQYACAKTSPPIPYGRRSGGITFHALRHTGTTRMVEAGVSLRIVQEIGGWKSLRQLERYAHPTEEAKRLAVAAIGSHVLSEQARIAKKGRVNA